MFGRQRRPKPLSLTLSVLLPHQLHHPPSKLHWLGSRTRTSRTAVLQPLGPFLPIPLPQPLRLPVTHPHQARRIHHLQLFAFHSRQRFHSTQFLLAHPDSPHPASFRGRSLGDISIEEKRGHYHRGSTVFCWYRSNEMRKSLNLRELLLQWASDSNFNGREAHGNLGDFFVTGQP